ncbi:MAG: hypothetical protein ACR2HE_06915 [Casimicrobiaceae bacterium]
MYEKKQPVGQRAGDVEPKERTTNISRKVTHLQDADDDTASVDGFKPLLPEERWFEAKFTGFSTAIIFGAHKVFWEFAITETGEWFEQKLFRAFRVRKVIGRPAKSGKFVLSAGGEMYETLVRLLDIKQRADRITLRPLRHMLFRVKTRTVRINSKQQPIADHAQYTVIAEIERGE